MMIPGLRCQAM